jgi:uncharacterized protein with ATP-grasp and redox domains
MKARFGNIDMGIRPECYPCFLKQAFIAMEAGGVREDVMRRVMLSVMRGIYEAGPAKTPSHLSSEMHRRIRRLLKADPFRGVKARYNRITLGMYPELKRTVSDSPDPLGTAARLAIAGNVIDFGIYSSVDIKGAVERALSEPLAVDDSVRFAEEVEGAGQVLYLLDNAGEAVFDRLLIEELLARRKKVTAAVKSGPVINDCTMEDARQAGIEGLCKVIETGSDHVGTILDHTSRSFIERFHRKEQIIISKGQGNFETLFKEDGLIYFMFQAKCTVVARALDLPEGAMLLARGGRG